MDIMRFTPDQDRELMRELLLHKPFAAAYGETMKTWNAVAAGLSKAIGITVNAKQVRDRVVVLKTNLRTSVQTTAFGSGIEESVDATNEQDHYSEIADLTHEYVKLEEAHISMKRTRTAKKKKQQETLEQHAAQIVSESETRRWLREEPDDAYSSSSDSTTYSMASTASTPRHSPAKRKNAFTEEAERQAKLARTELFMRREQFERQLQLTQGQHAAQLDFAREQADANRELILECVKVVGRALADRKR
ncbi:TPA: hypothetical protein N0F65_010283 [Lagenidium giganteum]|uniref:Uncharacterized protein n=1 Tax=Lagenidium giganteum TaxID=4803 RepID=A0AAV2YQQ7_9STRA|nr:TPA: hypothetical protein N0F65_010283 [Lagenidium giganteum]